MRHLRPLHQAVGAGSVSSFQPAAPTGSSGSSGCGTYVLLQHEVKVGVCTGCQLVTNTTL